MSVLWHPHAKIMYINIEICNIDHSLICNAKEVCFDFFFTILNVNKIQLAGTKCSTT